MPPPNKRGSKTQNGRFPSKMHALHLKKVCYKVSLCEYYQRQSVKPFTGLPMRSKIVRVGRPVLRENLAKLTNPLQKRRFPINIHS